MGLNDVASANRTFIAFFGRRNAGKSSLVNAVTSQSMSVVSPVKGTTTDLVKKSMEILPLGPVVIIDTPGMDDEGELGEMRVQKAREALSLADIAVLVVDAVEGMKNEDFQLINEFIERKIPYYVTHNKSDLLKTLPPLDKQHIYVSAKTGFNIDKFKELIGSTAIEESKGIVRDIISKGDVAVLVIPVDSSAPKGRLIMPQQMVIRDILDIGGVAVATQIDELSMAVSRCKPKLVITDSQAFGKVSSIVGDDIMLTSFSILMARYKGSLPELVKGASAINKLRSGDRVLIAEGCTHHRKCEDIGSVKIPKWLHDFTGKELDLVFSSGNEFPPLDGIKLVIHCGGCMLNEREMQSRVSRAVASNVPITNYGIAIALMHGVLRRSLMPFPDMIKLLDE